ncbi:MAG: FAD-binding oxidoreductase [Pseudomonadales bacterium]
MQRWNGGGDDGTELPLKPAARQFLAGLIGEGSPLPDASLAEVIARVPPSRLPEHPLIVGDREVRVRHARGQSLPDWLAMRSGDFGQFPDGVAFPEDAAQVRELLEFALHHDVAVIPYGGGTSVVGHITPQAGVRPVLTISLAAMSGLRDLDPHSQIATFGAGTPGPQVESQLKSAGYTLGHFPQSWELATIGGWVASRSSGQQSLRYGRIEQLFAGGHIETPVGSLEIPTVPASSAGPDIREMILGSEGRMGILTDVKVRVTPLPGQEDFHVAFFPDWDSATAALRALAQQKIPLSMMRLGNARETWSQLRLAGHAGAIALLEKYLGLRGVRAEKCMFTFGLTGSRAFCKAAMKLSRPIIRAHGGVDTGTLLGRKWQESRFLAPYLRHALWENGYAVDTVETAVDWNRVNPTLAAMESALSHALDDEGEKVLAYTHLSHLYPQGSSVYTTCVFRCADGYAATLARWQKLKGAASRQIVAQGGTISHQHGVGADHAPYLAAEKGALGIAAIGSLCRQFDPSGIMNPGKLIQDRT